MANFLGPDADGAAEEGPDFLRALEALEVERVRMQFFLGLGVEPL